MAIALVQANNVIHTSTAVTTQGVAFTGAVGAGDLLVCCVYVDNTADTITVADNINGSWTASVSVANGSSFQSQLFYFKNTASASANGLTVTATIASTAAHIALDIIEFSGADTSAPLDGTPSTKAVTSTLATITSNSYTSSGSADVLVAFLDVNTTVTAITAGAGYTIPTNGTNARSGVEYQLGVAAGANTASFTWTSNAIANIILAGFKAASGGGGPTTGELAAASDGLAAPAHIQLAHSPSTAHALEYDDHTFQIFLPPPAWDNDADDQLAQLPPYRDDIEKEQWTNFIIIPAFDPSASLVETEIVSHQLAMLPSAANVASDGGAEATQFLIIPSMGWFDETGYALPPAFTALATLEPMIGIPITNPVSPAPIGRSARLGLLFPFFR